jgi:hypothetical protein
MYAIKLSNLLHIEHAALIKLMVAYFVGRDI